MWLTFPGCNPSGKAVWAGTQGRSLKPRRSAAFWLAPTPMLCRFSYGGVQTHLPRDGATHSSLGSPVSVPDQDDALPVCPLQATLACIKMTAEAREVGWASFVSTCYKLGHRRGESLSGENASSLSVDKLVGQFSN